MREGRLFFRSAVVLLLGYAAFQALWPAARLPFGAAFRAAARASLLAAHDAGLCAPDVEPCVNAPDLDGRFDMELSISDPATQLLRLVPLSSRYVAYLPMA